MTTPLRARRHLLMNRGWKFQQGDIELAPDNTHLSTYMAYKAGEGLGPVRRDFFDGAWRTVDLPHDWAVETPFDPAANLDQGFHTRGVAWYRRAFRLDSSDEGRVLTLQFDGVATHCTVWVNGTLLGRNWCGYTPFRVDISDVATYGDSLNTVVVRVDASPMEGWWYEGAGIYRHVWLTATAPVHIAHDGVWANPHRRADGGWDTFVETTLRNAGASSTVVHIISTVYDHHGTAVATAAEVVDVLAGTTAVAEQNLRVDTPALWSLDAPTLYTLRTELWHGETLLDDQTTTFGYRTIAFDAEQGFLLNDVPVKLKGTSNHQDHAGIGVAVPDTLQAFRIARLKAMGANAYRCAHNPPAPALLDACDRLGMLVMDENRNFNSAPEVLDQVRAMILRDRNHPSVILWSICNEEPLQGTPAGAKIARAMITHARAIDPTRPITAAMHGGISGEAGMAPVVDVVGINYQLDKFDAIHAAAPALKLTGSENGCFFATRGEYATQPDRHYFSAYDTQAAPWGANARDTWRAVSARPFIAGQFIWTGFDYRGEPSPHAWPSINSHWGIMDTCGFPKDAFFLQQAYWHTAPMLHLLPHWNWPGREGEIITVMAYTNCTEVELFLNDRSLGVSAVDPIDMAAWQVPYAPGTLRAVGLRHGERVETVVATTGAPVALCLTPDRPTLQADNEDAMPITVSCVDADGRHVPTASPYVTFTLEGPGRILGVGNGDPTCHEPDVASARSLFNGLAQLIIQASDAPGTLRLTASSPHLEPITIVLPVQPATPRPSVRVADAVLIGSWRMSPISSERPDPNMAIADSDMNTWERIEISGESSPAFRARDGYAIFRATIPPSPGGILILGGVQGTAEIYLNGELRGQKTSTWEIEELSLPVSPSAHPQTLSVLILAEAGNGGLIRPVRFVPDTP